MDAMAYLLKASLNKLVVGAKNKRPKWKFQSNWCADFPGGMYSLG